MSSAKADQELIADFFAYVVFSGLPPLPARQGSRRKHLSRGSRPPPDASPTLNPDRKCCPILKLRRAHAVVHEAAGPDGTTLDERNSWRRGFHREVPMLVLVVVFEEVSIRSDGLPARLDDIAREPGQLVRTMSR